MTNGEKFKSEFGIYATELWAMSEGDFLKWLKAKAEPKHGRWIKLFETEHDITARCSECGMVYTLGKGRDPNYCGTCGTKMDEVEK